MARATISTMAPGRPPRHERAHKKGGADAGVPIDPFPRYRRGPPAPFLQRPPAPPLSHRGNSEPPCPCPAGRAGSASASRGRLDRNSSSVLRHDASRSHMSVDGSEATDQGIASPGDKVEQLRLPAPLEGDQAPDAEVGIAAHRVRVEVDRRRDADLEPCETARTAEIASRLL